MSALFERIAGLPLEVESASYEGLQLDVRSDYTRLATVVRLEGAGRAGRGEDVNWSAAEQRALRASRPPDVRSRGTLAEFSEKLDALELWPGGPPEQAASRDFRRWAFESAALDLALRQADLSLEAALGLEPDAVRFVLSTGLGSPPSLAPLERRIARWPAARFKVDAAASWDDEFCARLAELRRVDVIDLKGYYRDTSVDLPADPRLYERIVRWFPETILEDALLDETTLRILEPHVERLSFDAPIHSFEDVLTLPIEPRVLNVKPSRFGSLAALFDFIEGCAERDIALYAGGQFELGPGRTQVLRLASLFCPDAPNDCAPSVWHEDPAPESAPASPWPPARPPRSGF